MAMRSVTPVFLTALAVIFIGSTVAKAEPILWIHDEDQQLATVDAATGEISIIGNMGVTMTDVAFDPDGNLFGVSFDNLYSIDATDASSTLIGSHGIATGNALVFDTDATLYSAGAGTTNLYTLDITTGQGTVQFDMGFSSAGDLAFFEDRFFLSDTNDNLVEIDLDNQTASVVGSIGFSDVFGLATPGDGILYGVSGTQVITIDPDTGQGSLLSDYSGQGLGPSFGSSFFAEAGAEQPPIEVPTPATLSLLGVGLVAFGFGVMHRRRTT